MARIPYVDQEDLPPDRQSLLDTLSDEAESSDAHSLGGETLNVYRAMGNNADLLAAFQTYGSAVWDESGLSAREREFVILSVAFHADSAYEWHQHVRVALDEGLTVEEIRAVSGGDRERLDEDARTLVAYVGAFVDGTVDDDDHDRLAARYDDETVVGIDLLAGTYLGLARALDALAVETEVEFVGWDLQNR
ncbi:carboxymuconolactone decarboxylase family protein [Halorussus marinus]|uniref:carboxymuconolactone decarboxylase family protein n=1 Tax=Halorussus marinus TaxID=2505976 RepID=UPI00106EB0D2|nr:carboxymuconolactone decarboxylase family protein [Halorussus marinus]